jgi:alpha-tubulin suppressor-like RCC1 family protein
MFAALNFFFARKNAASGPVAGQLWSMGANGYGVLGLGNRTSYSSPKQIGAYTNWTINNNSGASLLVSEITTKSDGTLWSWGGNYNGMGGLGNTTYYSSPKQVGSLTDWLTAAANSYAACCTKTSGTLWTWGVNNTYGALGIGTNTGKYSSPKQVGSLTNWLNVQVSGSYSMVGIKTNGTLWAWGNNNQGGLGNGNTTRYSSPIQIGSLTNWLSITASGYSVTSVRTDGSMWSWGYNYSGQLGLGNKTPYSSPKQVGSLTTWLKVAGSYSMFATTINNALYVWGTNGIGQLGLGNTNNYSSPKQVGSLTDWNIVSNWHNSQSTLAVKTSNQLWAWGANGSGQLGLGNVTNYVSPKQVGALTSWNNCSVSTDVGFATKT